jgi:uncharacterized protein YbjT (DUF2867 family)
MTILITGANGTVSTALLHALSTRSGTTLRALVRDPGKAPTVPNLEVAVGDLERPETLGDAFAGIDTLWLLTAFGPQAPHASSNAVWAARNAGVRHIVRLSAIGAAHDAPTRNGRLHALSDHELRASGMDWTILKPASFMQNLLGAVVGDTLYGTFGDGRLGLIDVRDIGEFAAHILTDPATHAGSTYTLTGPASISLYDAAAAAGSALGARITYQPVSTEQAYSSMLDMGLSEWIASVAVEYSQAYAAGWGDFTTTDFSDVIGRHARSITQFADEYAADLRSSANL